MKMRQGCELAVLGLALMCVVGATPSEEAIPRKRRTLASVDKSWAFLLEAHNSSVPLGRHLDGTVGRRRLDTGGSNVHGTPPASFIVGEVRLPLGKCTLRSLQAARNVTWRTDDLAVRHSRGCAGLPHWAPVPLTVRRTLTLFCFFPTQIAECGGCKFLRDINGTLSKGDPDCGGWCSILDFAYQGITSIAPGTFSSMTGMNAL